MSIDNIFAFDLDERIEKAEPAVELNQVVKNIVNYFNQTEVIREEYLKFNKNYNFLNQIAGAEVF